MNYYNELKFPFYGFYIKQTRGFVNMSNCFSPFVYLNKITLIKIHLYIYQFIIYFATLIFKTWNPEQMYGGKEEEKK